MWPAVEVGWMWQQCAHLQSMLPVLPRNVRWSWSWSFARSVINLASQRHFHTIPECRPSEPAAEPSTFSHCSQVQRWDKTDDPPPETRGSDRWPGYSRKMWAIVHCIWFVSWQLSLASIHYMRSHFQEATDIYKRLLLEHRSITWRSGVHKPETFWALSKKRANCAQALPWTFPAETISHWTCTSLCATTS